MLIMEKVIHVDEKDHELGLVSREEAHRKGLLHRISVIYLTREDGSILVQERMSGRLDHSCAGHVEPGEDYADAAKRELMEELGIAAELQELGKTSSGEIRPDRNHDHVRHIFIIFECRAEPGRLGKNDVKSVHWSDPKEVWEKMKTDPDNKKFCGGFKSSLEFFLKKRGLI